MREVERTNREEERDGKGGRTIGKVGEEREGYQEKKIDRG